MAIDAKSRAQYARKHDIAKWIVDAITTIGNNKIKRILGEPLDSPENSAILNSALNRVKESSFHKIPNVGKNIFDLLMDTDKAYIIKAIAAKGDPTNLVRLIKDIDDGKLIDWIMESLPTPIHIEKCVCGSAPQNENDLYFCSNPDCVLCNMNVKAENLKEWNVLMCKTKGKAIPEEENISPREQTLPGMDDAKDQEEDQTESNGLTEEGMQKLEILFKAGKTIEDLTEVFSCPTEVIKHNLQKLHLIESEEHNESQ